MSCPPKTSEVPYSEFCPLCSKPIMSYFTNKTKHRTGSSSNEVCNLLVIYMEAEGNLHHWN